jgi:hypothetical protein
MLLTQWIPVADVAKREETPRKVLGAAAMGRLVTRITLEGSQAYERMNLFS